MLSLAPRRLFTGDGIMENATVRIRAGRIVDVTASPDADAIALDGLLAPGLIDIQINGGGGALFNDDPSVGTLKTIAQAHRQFGVTAFLATLISDERAKMARAMDAVAEAVRIGVDGVMGLHLEGPWLAEAKRGVHPAACLRDFDSEDLALLTRERRFPLLVTVAPERIERETIRALGAAGVVVSLGHTAASSAELGRAIEAGARGFTHLFNAMPPLQSRDPGPVGAALANTACWAGLILDGVHVHPLAAQVAFACKSAARLMLVSDSMATTGMTDASMSLFGETIRLEAGALRTASGTLAGAHLDLSAAVRNAVAMLGATPQEALRMASLTPAEFLGVDRERGRIAPGQRADLTLWSSTLELSAVWIGGEEVR
jgi:N-acetylglucosamine-6-phosphate deacetylase